MALSGSFTTGETQGLSNIYVEGVWSATQDISANQSRITLSAYLWHWELSNRVQPLTLTVDGQTFTLDAPAINTGDVWQRTFLGSHTFTVSHAGDGTKTVSMSVDYNAKITYSGKDLQHIAQSASGIALDTIPRASAFSTVPASVTAGNSLSVGITPASAAFNHKLLIRAGTQSYTVTMAAGVKTASYTIPTAWANEFPTSMSGTGKLTLETYNGSAKIGTAETSWTLAVPAYSMTASLSSAISGNSTAASWGTYIKGLTKAELTGSSATSYGASIRSLSISGGGFSQSAAGGSLHFTTGYLNTAGSISFVLTASDSRGKSVSKSVTISVWDYAQPSLSSVNTFRSDASKNANPSGTYITAAATYGCSSVNGKNKITAATVQYKLVTASSYTAGITSLVSGTPTAFGAGKIDVNASYDVLYTIQDALGGKATATASIPTQEVPLSFYPRNKGVTVGGVAEEEGWVSKYSKNRIKGSLTVDGAILGNASTAVALQTARTINGTSFNGSANITTANWGTARTITIGSTGKSVNGSGNVAWSLGEIGAAAAAHRHASTLLWSGSLTSGSITITNGMNYAILSIIGYVGSGSSLAEHTVATAVLNVTSLPVEIADDGTWMGLTVAKSGNNITVTCRNGSGTLKYISGY